RVRHPFACEPEPLVEADRVDDERVAVPVPDRVPVPARLEILRMLAPVQVDDAPAMRRADVQEQDFLRLRQIDDLDAIRCVPETRAAGGFAARVRIGRLALAAEEQLLHAGLE